MTAVLAFALALATPADIGDAYRTCLGRSPDPGGAAHWATVDTDTMWSGVCRSTEAAELHPGLVWFSSGTWLPPVMVDVRHCESGGDYRAENGRSSASGAWQFLNGTWSAVTGLPAPASAYPRHVQDWAAALLLTRLDGDPGRSMGWRASARCWR
jgi:hypothetical protein